MTELPTHQRGAAAADRTTERDRRDDEIRGTLEHDQDKADGTIDRERRHYRDVQEQTDTQRREARDTQDQAETAHDSDRRHARDAQDLIDTQADTQRRDARDAQDLINTQADTQRRDARDTQDLINTQADTQRRDARDTQDLINTQADTQRRDARDTQTRPNRTATAAMPRICSTHGVKASAAKHSSRPSPTISGRTRWSASSRIWTHSRTRSHTTCAPPCEP